jgi:hypothetical protein
LIRDVRWLSNLFHGQACSGLIEAALDEAGLVLDRHQAVPDDPDQVAEAGDGEVGQDAALQDRPDSLDGSRRKCATRAMSRVTGG